ncbi:ATP-grasp fold amidoligase family protein [uncultured Desulfovibrio sp.]|uniref:ATP-grasp fold amidoligase family protein n=1 Tax=uncultured Desulfovibrio sp. TaxID=167968 RepID=UPI0025D49695|nr:ATP-grasp fold amidoligase family protein [uncultured Desulfovibrio sp.]
MYIIKKIKHKIIHLLRKYQPFNALMYFYNSHGRLPNKSLRKSSFNDFLYYRKKQLWNVDLSKYTDKIKCKEYIKETIGSGYCVPIQGIFNIAEDIIPNKLTYPCVLKSNHASGQVIFLNSPNDITDNVLQQANAWLKVDYFKLSSEPSYKNIKPKLFVEPMLNLGAVSDYKFFCFSGIVKAIQVDINRFTNHQRCYYSKSWEKLKFSCHFPLYPLPLPRPNKLDEMIRIAEKVSKRFIFVRIDLFETPEKIFMGEMTFFPGNGTEQISPDSANIWLMQALKESPNLI